MFSAINKLKNKLKSFFISDHLVYNNLILPKESLRFCGVEFRDNNYFVNSAQLEIERLKKFFNFDINTRILDVGCGVGRLPIGILSKIGDIQNYTGIDVDRKSINWCKYHITKKHPNFHFIYINVKNLRYNPNGKNINNKFSFPFKNKEFDLIYLYSVFSHMTIEDIDTYLKEFKRILVKSGKIFLTAFIEENIPDMMINPKYFDKNWSGPLHCVCYDKKYFESIINNNDFNIDYFEYRNETDGQSAYYLSLIK
ncbi:MAG: class I SAM-dependent methyltransferase [Candidatus Hodarchaeota archaeon]